MTWTNRRRRLMRFAGALVATVVLAGCGGAPKFEPGCYLNGAVPARTRRGVESAAERFYSLLRATSYDQAWTEGSAQLHSKFRREDLTRSWASIAEVLTIPTRMTTEELAIVSVAPGKRGPQEFTCSDPADTSGGRRMVVTDQPLQAYLVQSGLAHGIRYNFASILFYEEGHWKVSSFGAQAREIGGHDWRWWWTTARAEKEAGRRRNAALLYNLAMDLCAPAPWIRPEVISVMTREQKKIHVEHLPYNRKESWVTADSTVFWPYRSAYELVEGGLAVKFFYEVPEPIDSLRVVSDAPKMADFVRTEFPEYNQIFREVRLEAVTPVDHRPIWSGRFPLK